ncbi:MAG: tRNA uridine-5-carboxymethylaminomethyl(34) synthesis GTPase MnmE, partial [Ignavibacteria bacterium]|nr:tRNA uridine-5-carboxymethylaminomethyl(34) synthesis GTPase MnmE [Ignavibacteria bacterium]NNJ52785.1 tRNA uridine-5-carboxymethylaminomethyl(34) synthesis GTPase MnmE [Ignavibacteriaceae bacterium]NNL22149.1 tRNA uridine-5-carboxymethylaminomethyl(34) synthesis GTPase MnmE [Ignavibacteriaceae bacterium]
GNSFYTEDDVVVSSLRHVNCLENAKGNLIKAKRTSENKLSGEYIASDIRAAENSLLEIVGKIAPDDVLNSIFSKFCIGK